MKLTDKEWSEVKARMSKKWVKDVELNCIARSFKGEKFIVNVDCGEGKKYHVPAEKLNEFYCVSPTLYDGEPHRTRRNITHTASGLTAGTFKTRTQAVRTWKQCKGLDIMYADSIALSNSSDFSAFAQVITDYRYS